VEIREGEGFDRGQRIEPLLFPSMPNEQDKIKSGFEDLLDTREDFSKSLVYSLGRFGKRKRREREREK
jgi:hypothetical protein